MSGKLKMMFLAAILLVASITSGCLTIGRGPQFTQTVVPDTDKAIIYVYRSRGVITAGTSPGVKLNDVSVVSSMYELSYFPLVLKPGGYTFTPKQFGLFKTTEATVNAKAGQVYFVRLDVSIGHIKLEQVSQDEAVSYMGQCYLLNPSVIIDPRVMVNKGSAASRSTANQVKKSTTNKIEKSATSQVKSAQLHVDPSPSTARIRIMNINPKFVQGIELEAGCYHIEVTSPGYAKYLKWITLEPGEVRTLPISLAPNG